MVLGNLLGIKIFLFFVTKAGKNHVFISIKRKTRSEIMRKTKQAEESFEENPLYHNTWEAFVQVS